MDSAFISYSFSKHEDRDIVFEIENVFRSFGVRTDNGRDLGGEELTDEVMQKIDNNDCLVALGSRRDQLTSGEWQTHDWVVDEYGYAITKDKPAIMLIETDVKLSGAYSSREHILFDRGNAEKALFELTKKISVWKRKAGGRLKVRVLPESIEENHQQATFEYRYVHRGRHLEWNSARAVPEEGGVFLHLTGAREDYLVEVKATVENKILRSPATSQTMPITLNMA